MTLSVIIPAFEHLADVLVCLNSLQALATYPNDIHYHVQDDASPSVDFRRMIPRCAASVDRNPVNLGFSGNCNAGAKQAQGDILCFVNQDIEGGQLSLGWNTVISAAFDDPAVGIVAPRLLFPDGRVQSAGGIYDSHLQPAHRCLGYSDLTNWEVNTPEYVSWATGAFIAIRREVFEKVGGFDEAYIGGYWEDVDLNERVKAAGYKIWYEPRTSFIHKVGSSGGSPHFMRNAAIWKARYVDTRKVKADTSAVLNGWW